MSYLEIQVLQVKLLKVQAELYKGKGSLHTKRFSHNLNDDADRDLCYHL